MLPIKGEGRGEGGNASPNYPLLLYRIETLSWERKGEERVLIISQEEGGKK